MGKIARRGLWIAGESVSGEQSRWFATMNPATDEVICEVAESLDGGKPISETPEADVDSGADCLEYFAGQALTRHPGIAKISLTEEAGTGKKFMGGPGMFA
jgi:betaine-aldehyde dehydrogenase